MFPFWHRFSHELSRNVSKQPFNFRFCNFSQVLSNQSSITGRVQPSSVSLETKETTSCQLILSSQQDASPGTVTQVNVTATPASHNVDIKQLGIFSLTITTYRKLPVKNDDLEISDVAKEKKLENWQLGLIIFGVIFSVLLVLVIVICVVYRNPIKRAAKYMNPNKGTGKQLQLDTFDDAIE